jgi:hypothetical protein
MPYQVHDALLHAMSGTELSVYEPNSGSFLLSLTTKDCSRREEPTLLCNQVVLNQLFLCGYGVNQASDLVGQPCCLTNC